MIAHRIETSVDEHGALHLTELPFQPGVPVEVSVLERPSQNQEKTADSAAILELFGTVDFGPSRD